MARPDLTALLAMRPAPPARRTAARAAGCVLLALLTLRLLGRVDLAIYATFGAFASVYAAPVPRLRWRTQLALGLVLTAAVATGAVVGLSAHRQWWLIPVAAVWAGLAAALSDRFGWRPPGPLFATFAVAACGSIPTTAGDLGAAIVTTAGTAGLAVLAGVAETRFRPELPVAATPTARTPTRAAVHPPGRRRVQALRCAAAVVVAGLLATRVGIGHPYWAMVAAVVPLAAVDLTAQLTRGLHRVIGTVAGLLLAGVLLLLSLPTLVVIVLAAALQGLTELVVARNYALALVFVTPLALLLGQLADHQPVGSLLGDRLVETVLGVAVGLATAYLTRSGATSQGAADARSPR